jgi:hypothetical protein
LLILLAITPVAAWMIRNYALTGDLTGAAARNRMLGMTPAPISDYWRHPIFTAGGMARFWAELTATFWRGELVWLTQRLTIRAIDVFYVASTALCIGTFVVANIRKRSFLVAWCFGVYALHIGLLGFLSILFDYENCPFPSKDWPFFSSGRLTFGAIGCFAVMYLVGLDTLLSAIGLRWARWLVLAGLVAIVLTTEVIISIPVFFSPFNAFHLW